MAVLDLLRLGFPARRRGDPSSTVEVERGFMKGAGLVLGSLCRGVSPAPWVSGTQRSSWTTVSQWGGGAVPLVSFCLPGLFALAEASAEPSRASWPCSPARWWIWWQVGEAGVSPRRPEPQRLVHIAHGVPVRALARQTCCVTCR